MGSDSSHAEPSPQKSIIGKLPSPGASALIETSKDVTMRLCNAWFDD